MRAGLLRQRVTLRSPEGSADAYGARVTEWNDVATGVPAYVRPINGRQQFLASQRQASSTYLITIRYDSSYSDLASDWTVLWGERVFRIDEPPRNLDERDREIELYCTEGLSTE